MKRTLDIVKWWIKRMEMRTSDKAYYSEHAGKLKLAVQTKVNFNFQPPPREVLLELARNSKEMLLPNSITGPRIPLSPDEDILISPNYQHVIPRRPLAQADEEMEKDEDVVNPNVNLSKEQKTGNVKLALTKKPPERMSGKLLVMKLVDGATPN